MEWQGVESAVVKTPAKGEQHPGGRRARQGNARDRRHVLGQVAGHRAAAGECPDLRGRLLPGPRAGLLAPLHALRAERRAARDLADRAAQQVAPPVAGSARPGNAALRDQQAVASRFRPTSWTGPRPGGGSRTRRRPNGPTGGGCRTWSRPAKTWFSRPCATPNSASGHLEKWAEMLQILKDIAANRMPSVADLLKQASQSPMAAASAQRDKTPMAGMVRDTRSGAAGRRSRATPRRPRPRSLRSWTGSRRSSRWTRTTVSRLPPSPRASLA